MSTRSILTSAPFKADPSGAFTSPSRDDTWALAVPASASKKNTNRPNMRDLANIRIPSTINCILQNTTRQPWRPFDPGYRANSYPKSVTAHLFPRDCRMRESMRRIRLRLHLVAALAVAAAGARLQALTVEERKHAVELYQRTDYE